MQSMKAFVPSRTKGVSPLTHGRASQIRTEETKDAITPARSHQRGASTKARMDRGMRLRFVLSGDGVSSRLARTTCLVHRPRSLLVLRRTYWERSTQERREQLASRSHRQPQARVPRSVAAPPALARRRRIFSMKRSASSRRTNTSIASRRGLAGESESSTTAYTSIPGTMARNRGHA